MERENSRTPCSLRSDDSFGSQLSLEMGVEMTQRRRRIWMERCKADGDRDDSDSYGSQSSLEIGFEMVQRRRPMRMASQESVFSVQQGPSLSPHFTSAAAETSKEAEVSRDLSQGSNPKPTEDKTGTDAKVDVKPKPQEMSGSTQDPTSEPVNGKQKDKVPEPVNGKQESKLPDRKPLPARKSRACNVM